MHTQIVFFNIDERGFSLIASVSKKYVKILVHNAYVFYQVTHIYMHLLYEAMIILVLSIFRSSPALATAYIYAVYIVHIT